VTPFPDGKVRVWAWTWAEVMERARYRMKFVRDQLDYEANDENGLKYLQRLHDGLLPASIRADAPSAAPRAT
jgi:hypothetical protein